MGYPGTMAAGESLYARWSRAWILKAPHTDWIDYLVCDPLACPPEMSAAERWLHRRQNKDETSRLQDSFQELGLETDLDAVADPESLSEDWML